MLIDNIGIPNSWPSHRAGRHPDDLQRRRRDPDLAEQREARLDTRLRSPAAEAPAREVPRYGLLLPAGQHHQPDSEFRPARADRSAGGRAQRGGQLSRSPRSSPPGSRTFPAPPTFTSIRWPSSREIRLNVDRAKASQLGLTQRDVTSSMLISLSGSATVAPNFWMNWTNGVNYNIGVQTPQYRMDSLDALLRTPISVASNAVNTTTPGSQAGAAGGGNAFVGASPSGSSQAYGNPGADRRQHAASFESGHRAARATRR